MEFIWRFETLVCTRLRTKSYDGRQNASRRPAPSPGVSSLGDVSTQIDVILFAKLEAHSSAAGGEQIIALPDLGCTRNQFTDAAESNNSQSLWQAQTVFQRSEERRVGKECRSRW